MAGQENKISNEIESLKLRGELAKTVNEVLVPTKAVLKIKRGQKVQEMQKLFPGYVFLNADLSGDALNLITSIPKAMGFLGSKNNPKSIAQEKIDEIKKTISEDTPDNKNLIFEIGETLNIIEGPFESFTGVVEDFDVEKQKVKISVLIFGRATSVELEVTQVEKVL
jgi:transcriptional antiterminator NusG